MDMVSKMAKMAAHSKTNISKVAQKSSEKGKQFGQLAQLNARKGAAASRNKFSAAKVAAGEAKAVAMKKSKAISERLCAASLQPNQDAEGVRRISDRPSCPSDGLNTPKSIASSSFIGSLSEESEGGKSSSILVPLDS